MRILHTMFCRNEDIQVLKLVFEEAITGLRTLLIRILRGCTNLRSLIMIYPTAYVLKLSELELNEILGRPSLRKLQVHFALDPDWSPSWIASHPLHQNLNELELEGNGNHYCESILRCFPNLEHLTIFHITDSILQNIFECNVSYRSANFFKFQQKSCNITAILLLFVDRSI